MQCPNFFGNGVVCLTPGYFFFGKSAVVWWDASDECWNDPIMRAL